MVEENKMLGKGAKDGGLDAKFLHKAFGLVREAIANHLDEPQLKRIDELDVKASLPPSGALSEGERRIRYAHLFRPGDSAGEFKVEKETKQDENGEDFTVDVKVPVLTENYLLCVGANGTPEQRVSSLLKGMVKAAFHKNGKAKDCQRVFKELGYNSAELHDLSLDLDSDEGKYMSAVLEEIVGKSGKCGTTIVKRKAKKQGTPSLKIACDCIDKKGKRLHFRLHESKAEFIVGTYHGDGVAIRKGGQGGCGGQFEDITPAAPVYAKRGEDATEAAA